jgi:ABC-type branched-subunit amino acid transport system ATPase component
VLVDGEDMGGMSEAALARFRHTRIGFAFQFFNLLPTLTVLENVLGEGISMSRPPDDLAGILPIDRERPVLVPIRMTEPVQGQLGQG